MGKLTSHSGIILWCILFPKDIVLVDFPRDVNAKLEVWRKALDSKGFRTSGVKREYMECKSSGSPSANVDRETLQN